MNFLVQNFQLYNKSLKDCFPKNLSVSQGGAEGNIEIQGRQYWLFPKGPVIKYLIFPF